MISLRAYNDKAVGIYGAGSAGLSAHAAFAAAGAHPFFWDENETVRERVSAAGIKCTPPKDWPWDELAVIVPGFSTRSGFVRSTRILGLAAEHKVPVKSDVDLFAEVMAARPEAERPRIVGVTGTHGKSVTAALITHVLNASGHDAWLGGTAGDSVLNLPEGGATTTYVLEILPQTLAFTRQLRCDAGVLLNLTALDVRYFKTPDKAVRAATRIFRNQRDDDAMVIGVDDTLSQKICTAITASFNTGDNIIAVSGEATLGLGVFSLDGRVFDARSDKTASLGTITRAPGIFGAHFNQAAAAAYAVCLHLGLTAPLITRAVTSWPGLPGRLFCMGDHEETVFFDDGASSWLPSTIAALNAGEDIIWIGGGEHRQRDYARLREAGDGVLKAFLYGDAAQSIAKATARTFDSVICASPEEAIRAALKEAKRLAEEEDIAMPMVLFSPGCPGAGQGANQALFTRIVQSLIESDAA